MVAYGYAGGNNFKQLWKYDAQNGGGAEAHQIRIADVNYDDKDEVLHMGYCLNGDGTLRWRNNEIVHGDRWFVGAFAPEQEGKEMMCYGIHQKNPSGLLEYYMNANTGKIIWKNSTTDGSTYDVGRGCVGDVDPNHEDFECWSFQGTWSMDGEKISEKYLYPSLRLWWDGDLMSESCNDSKIEKWDSATGNVSRVVTTWKITPCSSSDRGAPMFYGDILGDWQILRKNRRRFPKAPILWKLLRKRLAAPMCNPLQQRNGNGGKHNTFRTESNLQTEKEFEEASFLFSLA